MTGYGRTGQDTHDKKTGQEEEKTGQKGTEPMQTETGQDTTPQTQNNPTAVDWILQSKTGQDRTQRERARQDKEQEGQGKDKKSQDITFWTGKGRTGQNRIGQE